MHRYVRLLLFVLISSCFYSCSTTPDQLKTAEQLMETAPDSALHVLKRVKVNSFSTPSNRALYALLMSQALDKNDVKVESDSLIAIATRYFDQKDPVHAAYAWFYMARCANNRGNAKMEADALFKAQEFAGKTRNYKLCGLVYGDKGIMYKNQLQFDSSLFYHKMAVRAFRKINDERNSILGLLNAGADFLTISKYDSALTYYNMAGQMASRFNDPVLLSTIYRNLGCIYLMQKKYDQAISCYRKVPLTHIAIYDSNKWLLLSNVFLKAGNTDSARFYLDKVTLLHEMAPWYYQLRQMLCEQENHPVEALYYSKKAFAATDSLNKRKLDISFAGLEKKYRYQSLQITNQKLIIKNNQNNMLLLIALFILSVGLTTVLWGRNRTKNQQLKVQKQVVEKEKENNLLLEKQLKFQEILLLNVAHYRNQSVKRPANSEANTTPAPCSTFYEELIACMDIQYNNISQRLSDSYPDLTERDILICCLLLAGFESGMIASVLDVKVESIIKQRYRLRTRLGLRNTENLMYFLASF